MSSILINQLVVVGRRKNYTVNFNPGVNIIYGDIATGKSSILNLINYLLGAKKFDTYPEIEAVARYAVLDVYLNQDRYTIKRDIFNPSALVEVYPCEFGKIEEFACKKYIPNFKKLKEQEEYEFFSDFLLSALNLTNIKIKDAPTKDNSSLSRLSFRDIFKFCYVDQDDLGSKRFLHRGDYFLESKVAEVFKYLFNTLDSQTAELSQEISSKSSERSDIERKFNSVSEFLRESGFGSLAGLDNTVTKVDSDISDLKEQIKSLNERAVGDDDIYQAAKSALEEIEMDVKCKQQEISELADKIERFTRLKNDYLTDISKFNASVTARKVIGEIEQEVSLCPVCDSTLEIEVAKQRFEIPEAEKVKHEVNSLKRRVRDTENLINESRKQWEISKANLIELVSQRKKARDVIEIHTKDIVSPYISERDTFVIELGRLEQKRAELVSRLKIRNQHNSLNKKKLSLDKDIERLKSQLEELEKKAPSMDEILSSMGDSLKDYLDFIKIKDPTGISLTSNKFFPVVRGVDYQSITSGGLRTIICIGYLCSFMTEALSRQMSYPSFLMIDTVGKYLGKTKSKYAEETSVTSDLNEGVSDPTKYQNIFEHIINLAEKYENSGETCQIILVDNDVPSHIVSDFEGFIVAHFSSERENGLPVGFIDDAEVNYDAEAEEVTINLEDNVGDNSSGIQNDMEE